MPRTGDIYAPPAGTKGTPDTTIQSAKYNAFVDDLTLDANNARPVTAGGTGATNATLARSNLGADNASNLLSGTVADARLPSTMAGKVFSTSVGIGQAAGGTNFNNGKALAIGDSDTGFRESADGVLEAWTNDEMRWQISATGNIRFTGTSFTYGGNTIWHAGNDGAGSGLDADNLDGMAPSTAKTANTIVQRDGTGNIRGNDIYPDRGDSTGYLIFPGASKYFGFDGTQFNAQGGHLLVGGARYQTDGNIYFSGSMASSYGSDLGAALVARALGAWQDLTGSRALSTTYQNTTGHPLFVSIKTSAASVFANVGASAGSLSEIGGSSTALHVLIMVPIGWYYSCTAGGSISYWKETRA